MDILPGTPNTITILGNRFVWFYYMNHPYPSCSVKLACSDDFVSKNSGHYQTSWCHLVTRYAHESNTTPHSTTKYKPLELATKKRVILGTAGTPVFLQEIPELEFRTMLNGAQFRRASYCSYVTKEKDFGRRASRRRRAAEERRFM